MSAEAGYEELIPAAALSALGYSDQSAGATLDEVTRGSVRAWLGLVSFYFLL